MYNQPFAPHNRIYYQRILSCRDDSSSLQVSSDQPMYSNKTRRRANSLATPNRAIDPSEPFHRLAVEVLALDIILLRPERQQPHIHTPRDLPSKLKQSQRPQFSVHTHHQITYLFLPTRARQPNRILDTLTPVTSNRLRPSIKRKRHSRIMRVLVNVIALPAVD